MFRKLLERRILIILLLLIQLLFLIYLIITGSLTFRSVNRLLNLISVVAALYIVSKKDKGAYRLLWIMLILTLPLFGGLLYLLSGYQTSTRKFADSVQKPREKTAPLYGLPGDGYAAAKKEIPQELPQPVSAF